MPQATAINTDDARVLLEKHATRGDAASFFAATESLGGVHYDEHLPLRAACNAGNLAIVKKLVDYGADIAAKKGQPLARAAGRGHLDIVTYLVEEAGAEINANNASALKDAAKKGRLDVTRYLIEHGADVQAGENFALRYAAKGGHAEVVEALIAAGADIHARRAEAMVTAAAKGHADVVFLLADHGMPLDVLGGDEELYDTWQRKLRDRDTARAEQKAQKNRDDVERETAHNDELRRRIRARDLPRLR